MCHNSSRIMIIIEIYNISLLIIPKPTNSYPPLILTRIGNEKCATVCQFKLKVILTIISYRINHINICKIYVIKQ